MSTEPQAAYIQKVNVTFEVLFVGPESTFLSTTAEKLAEIAVATVRQTLPEPLREAIDELYAPRFSDSRRYVPHGEDIKPQTNQPLEAEMEAAR